MRIYLDFPTEHGRADDWRVNHKSARVVEGAFLKVSLVEHQSPKTPGASDRFTLAIDSISQPFEMRGRGIDRLVFDIVGSAEMDEFFDAMDALRAHRRH